MPISVRCNMCNGCRLDHKRDWGLRGMHENQMHDNSQFVTLTYDEEHIPPGANLLKPDVQKFFKRLRKHLTENNQPKVRFMYCGEYGPKTSRPHYHAIIWGLNLTDLQYKLTSDKGNTEYSSDTLSTLWPHGTCTASNVTFATCSYVAGYMLKDTVNRHQNVRNAAVKDGHNYVGNYQKTEKAIDAEGNITKIALPYENLDVSTGEITTRERPYANYSSKPGIGRSWLEKYYKDCFPSDTIHHDGTAFPIPGYYYRALENIDPDLFLEVQANRKASAIAKIDHKDNTKERRVDKAIVRDARITLKNIGPHNPEPNRLSIT